MSETEALDLIEDAAEIATRTTILRLVVLSSTMWWAGCGLTFYLTKRYYKKKYEELATIEIAEAKAFYAKLNKADVYATPESAAEALSKKGQEAVEALTQYQGDVSSLTSEEVGRNVVVAEQTTVERKNVFAAVKTDEDWDQDQEESMRDAHPDNPHILHQDEYMAGDLDYQQVTLTYYAEDDVLVDEREQPIEDIERTVGEDNLTRFGHGSRDNRILYVRNNRIQMDFEIVKNESSYAREVAGFIQHEDMRPKIQKFRGERD
jgi:hypothetical protein